MTKFEQFRDSSLDISGDTASFYPREFYAFDNFSSFQVEWREQLWATSEHAYHGARYMETAPEITIEIQLARSAHGALLLSKTHRSKQQANWDEVKEGVMLDICRHKLQQHLYIQEKLEQTGAALIVEDSPVDSYWGWGHDRNGRNTLGKIWMVLRDEMRSGKIES